MQRPRKHPSDADRSTAYREPRESVTQRVDRKAVEALLAAVEAAAAAGEQRLRDAPPVIARLPERQALAPERPRRDRGTSPRPTATCSS